MAKYQITLESESLNNLIDIEYLWEFIEAYPFEDSKDLMDVDGDQLIQTIRKINGKLAMATEDAGHSENNPNYLNISGAEIMDEHNIDYLKRLLEFCFIKKS